MSELNFEIAGATGILTLNRPEARNALTMGMYRGIADTCANPPEEIKALIITGAGDRAFAAGTDINHFRDFGSAEQAVEYERSMDEVLEQIESCPVPTIAAISGACTGGGAVIAATCDIRICTESLKYGFPIARTLGNCLSAANLARLAALIGHGRTREMIFTARLLQAEEARAIGLVSEVLPDHTALMVRSAELAETLAGHAPLTLRATRAIQARLINAEAEDRDWIVKCYTSEDFREGMDAFLSKRPPSWKGK